jgi:hypothetical protein
MAYVKQTWVDGQAGGTPVSAARLNHMEDGIEAASTGGGAGTVTSVNGVGPDGTGNVVITAGDVTPDADSATKGKIQLTKGLTGTADAPDVVGAPWDVVHDGTTDPPRPATNRPVHWYVPADNPPAGNGTVGGGSYAAVDGDKMWTWAP